MSSEIIEGDHEEIRQLLVDICPMYEDVEIPEYSHIGDSGMDLHTYFTQTFIDECIDNPSFDLLNASTEPNMCTISLKAGCRGLISTGIKIEIPFGYEIQVRSRSGLALNHGIIILNSPGTIDSTYRGEIGLIMLNTSNEDFSINHCDRLAQLVLAKVEMCRWVEVDELSDTKRGIGGYGHTGI